MNNRVIILGAGGRFGRAATQAFLHRGWQVTVLQRSVEQQVKLNDINYVFGDIYNIDSLTKAVKGHDVVVNALNPPYPDWSRDVPRITSNVIAAALSCSATVMIPGNVYNYGKLMPDCLLESTEQLAFTKKGRIRIQMEQDYLLAAKRGLQTIVLRAGDFIEKKKTGNWFDSYIINRIEEGIFTYPGSLNQCHAWAFLPDMAQAMAQLAEKRTKFSSFEEFGFEGFNITGQELKNDIEVHLGRTLKIKKIPWFMMRIAAVFSPMVKEVLEMRYLWEVPHKIDGTKLKRVLPEFRPRNLTEALKVLL